MYLKKFVVGSGTAHGAGLKGGGIDLILIGFASVSDIAMMKRESASLP
jgi:hypothetical protein